MRLSYLVPENQYKFFRELGPELHVRGIDVKIVANPSHSVGDSDVILAAMLPQTPGWCQALRETTVPYILWHWDSFSFVDATEPRWAEFYHLMNGAADVWSCSYETARQLKEQRGIDSYVVPAWYRQSNLRRHLSTEDYAFYSVGVGCIGKRVDWAKQACEMLKIKFVINEHQRMARDLYFETLARCGVYLMTAFEESNGTVPAMEAMANGKPVVCADIPSNREVFGEYAYYFNNWDFNDLKRALREAWSEEQQVYSLGAERMVQLYSLPVVADRVAKRLKEVVG